MELFINDIAIRLHHGESQSKIPTKGIVHYPLAHKELNTNQHVYMRYPSTEEVSSMIDTCCTEKTFRPYSIDIVTRHYNRMRHYIAGLFKEIHAAGGVVRKKDKLLLIYRLKKWDFPKGKIEQGENELQAAKREIVEECNITVKPGKKICVTRHMYQQGGHRILKHTHWYAMEVKDDTHMAPCTVEYIEKVEWMDIRQVREALKNTYQSIRFVFQKYIELTEETANNLPS